MANITRTYTGPVPFYLTGYGMVLGVNQTITFDEFAPEYVANKSLFFDPSFRKSVDGRFTANPQTLASGTANVDARSGDHTEEINVTATSGTVVVSITPPYLGRCVVELKLPLSTGVTINFVDASNSRVLAQHVTDGTTYKAIVSFRVNAWGVFEASSAIANAF